MTLASRLKKKGVRQPKPRKTPLWKGPEEDGITQSMLSRFLVCRERFRLLVVEGLKPKPTFNHRIHYGDMWHVCEEALAGRNPKADINKTGQPWLGPLRECCKELTTKYPLQQEEIVKWYNVCKVQFPEYVRHWIKHPDVKQRKPLVQECKFSVPYKLPSGRIVLLRGKWDSVDIIGTGKAAGIYLQENKTKGDIHEEELKKQLKFDLQTGIYLVALEEYRLKEHGWPRQSVPTRGVRYNVVRRPLSGGKGSIRQHKPSKKSPRGETKEEFYERLRRDYIAAEPEHYFMRWRVEVMQADLDRFKREFLDPILEQLCDWWEHIQTAKDPFEEYFDREDQANATNRIHWRTPYGFYNVLAEGGSSELDEYLNTGSELGLTRTDDLFPELV